MPKDVSSLQLALHERAPSTTLTRGSTKNCDAPFSSAGCCPERACQPPGTLRFNMASHVERW